MDFIFNKRLLRSAAMIGLTLLLKQAAFAQPVLHIDAVPAYGESGQVSGSSSGFNRELHSIVLFVFAEGIGWYQKPVAPLTSDASKWRTELLPNHSDLYMTRIYAAAVKRADAPMFPQHVTCLPSVLDSVALAALEFTRPAPTICFAGQRWHMKSSHSGAGPGNNIFSDSNDHVWLDAAGALHLRFAKTGDIWRAAEVISEQTVGYGTYRFRLTADFSAMDPHIVMGLFTWDNEACAPSFHREIDIEFSRWGDRHSEVAQYVVQPFDQPGNRYRWALADSHRTTEHIIRWMPDSLSFTSFDAAGRPLQEWHYSGDGLPMPGDAHFRINLWRLETADMETATPFEVILSEFHYTPFSPAAK